MTEPPHNNFAILMGASLVLAGALLVAAQFAGITVVVIGWPVLVMVPGALTLAAAFSMPAGRRMSFLAVPGALVLTTGIVLEVQAITGDWDSWSYAWAIIAPGSVGAGLLIAGIRERMRGVRTAGIVLLLVGVALFVAAEWLFVRVMGVGGPGLGRSFGAALPIMVIVLGLWVVARGLRRAR